MAVNPVSKDILDKLVVSGVIFSNPTVKWFGRLLRLPDKPREAVAIVEGSGAGSGYYLDDSKKPWRTEGIQVFVRGKGYDESWDRAELIRKTIDEYGHFVYGGCSYKSIKSRGSIAPFAVTEADDLYIWVMNFLAQRVEL